MLFTRAEGVLSVRALTQHFAEKTAGELVDVPELFEAADAVIAVTAADACEFVRAAHSLMAEQQFAPVAFVVRDKHLYRMVNFAAALCRLGSAPNMAVFGAYGSALDWLLLRDNPFSNRPKRNGTGDT